MLVFSHNIFDKANAALIVFFSLKNYIQDLKIVKE